MWHRSCSVRPFDISQQHLGQFSEIGVRNCFQQLAWTGPTWYWWGRLSAVLTIMFQGGEKRGYFTANCTICLASALPNEQTGKLHYISHIMLNTIVIAFILNKLSIGGVGWNKLINWGLSMEGTICWTYYRSLCHYCWVSVFLSRLQLTVNVTVVYWFDSLRFQITMSCEIHNRVHFWNSGTSVRLPLAAYHSNMLLNDRFCWSQTQMVNGTELHDVTT